MKTKLRTMAPKVTHSEESFESLMTKVPARLFMQMVNKSGLPANEARELCEAFKDLR